MTAPALPPASTLPSRQTAFISQPVDFLLVGGLSLLHLLVFYSFLQPYVTSALGTLFGPLLEPLVRFLYHQKAMLYHAAGIVYPYELDFTPNVYDFAVVAAMLTWVINHPHFSATSHRLYRSPTSMMQFPMTAFAVPVMVIALLCLSLVFPATVAPWFIKIFLIWSPYHFSAQTLGITMLYARRAGFAISPRLRKLLVAFIFSSYLGPTLASESSASYTYYDMIIPTFGLPPDLFILYKTIIQVLGIICLALLMRQAWLNNQRLPLLMLVPALAQYNWFITGAGVNGFQEFVPAYHSLQYLTIAWALHLKEKADEGHMPRTPLRVSLESGRWFAANVGGGVALFYALPLLAGMLFTVNPYMAAGITVAAVQVHHFFVDGVIWKLRNPRVAQPLMTTLAELTGRSKPA